MKTELFISWRYLVTKRKEKFISLISIISILGVAIGVAALIIVIAVMSGFDKDLREKIVGNYAHITVSGYQAIDSSYPALIDKIKANPRVLAVSPYVQGQILIKEQNKFFALALRGMDPAQESKVTKIKEYMIRGNIDDLGQNQVIIGRELALHIGAGIGSELLTYSPTGKEYKLKVAGIFNSGMYDYDMNLIFTTLASAQELMGFGANISAIAVKLDNLYSADKVRDELASVLGFDYNLKTWTEMNRNFFAALKLEKFTMFVILTLIILVAALNIVSMLMVMVVEKTKDIGILKTIGMDSAAVRRVFTYQGLTIGILGTSLGAFLGIALCMLLKKYQFIKLPQDIYYIDRLPVSIVVWPDMVLVISAAMFITLVSVIYPAAKAAGMNPVEALRYE